LVGHCRPTPRKPSTGSTTGHASALASKLPMRSCKTPSILAKLPSHRALHFTVECRGAQDDVSDGFREAIDRSIQRGNHGLQKVLVGNCRAKTLETLVELALVDEVAMNLALGELLEAPQPLEHFFVGSC